MPIVDAHAHLEERMLDLPTMIAQLDARGIDRVALIPVMGDPLPSTPDLLLAFLRRLLRSPLYPAAKIIDAATRTKRGDLRLGRKIFQIYRRPDNDSVAAAIAKRPDRFLGWIFLNPRQHDALDELERLRALPGFVGVKLHPFWHDFALREALPLARRCEELGLPMLVHMGFGPGGDWRVLADACPRLRLIFAHAGIPHYDRLWPHLRTDRRLWIDVSSPYLDEALVRDAVAAVGPERALYGTDAPYGFHGADGTYDYGVIRGWVERLPAPARGIDRILGENVLEIIGDR
jgi:predicted TIM-barrel fold metal-dependent hydrolase